MFRPETVPDDRNRNVCGVPSCRQHGQVTTSSTAETPEQQLNLCPDACASVTKQDNLLPVKRQ